MWYLVVAEEILSTKRMNPFKQANIISFDIWVLPEEKNLETVKQEQIFVSNVNAMYCLSGTHAKVIVDKDYVEVICKKVRDILTA